MPVLRVALCQIDTVVGDLDGNVERVMRALDRAEAADCDLAVFPEMTVPGYPPEDLVLKAGFLSDNRRALEKLASRTSRCVAVVGFADHAGDATYNAAAVCAGGRIAGVYHKRELPDYAVFDELRTFRPGTEPLVLFEVAGVRIGVSVCEDLWIDGGPAAQQAAGGAELIVNINGSPFHRHKIDERAALLRARATETGCPIVYLNLVGGQDELVFDGGSMVMSADGRVTHRAPQFSEAVLVADVEVAAHPPDADALPVVELGTHPPPARGEVPAVVHPPMDPIDELYTALVVGTRDYVGKSGFSDVAVGLSGGIDSSLVATIAVDALGADHVHGVLMPSRYTSSHSVDDALALVANLGIEHLTVSIEPPFAATLDALAPVFAGRPADLTEENLQSRLRGLVLMGLSNKFGWLVLATGNKSEAAVGYATLYGDTAGAFAVIKDVWKTSVYELARHVNEAAGGPGARIPERCLHKPPSAELRPDQRDDQSLPPYDELDPLLEAYVERDLTAHELVARGFDAEMVERVTRLVDAAEYKRRQSPLGVRVSTKAFGRDRRIPVVNHYRG